MAGRAFSAPTLFLLKITLVPLVVWLASAAGRRWGHGVTGWVSGLPLIAGPISVFLALDQGAAFAAALHGPAATTRLLAGFISGLLAFAAFHVVVATALPAFGIAAAYLFACAAALATTAAVARVRARSG